MTKIIMQEIAKPKNESQDCYDLIINGKIILNEATFDECANYYFYKCNSKDKLKIECVSGKIYHQTKNTIRKTNNQQIKIIGSSFL